MGFFYKFYIANVLELEYNKNNKRGDMMIAYMTAGEAAKKWGVSHRRVITLCQENRIPDVGMLGNMWIIPSDATKPIDGRTTRYAKFVPAKPFIKWAGGKGQLLPTIKKFSPSLLGTEIKKYCEPMVGAGAVLFDILNTYEMDEVYICDTNVELINTYKIIKDNVDELIELLISYENEHLKRDDECRKEYYYHQRDLFNTAIVDANEDNSLLRAALFIYINKTWFNGLYRVNKKGLYNVPMGSYKNPKICDVDNLKRVSELLQNVTILCGDYSCLEQYVDENTFVYVDLSKEFGDDTENLFLNNNHIKFTRCIDEMYMKGAKIVVPNLTFKG